MAGIKEAMQRVMDHKNTGKVLATGEFEEGGCGKPEPCPDCIKIKYMILRIEGNGKIYDNNGGEKITVYDYGSDIHINDKIEVGNSVMLNINDNWNATWELIEIENKGDENE